MNVADKIVWLIERQVQGVRWPLFLGSLFLLFMLRAAASILLARDDERVNRMGSVLLRLQRILAVLWVFGLILDITLFQEGKARGDAVLKPFDPGSWLAAAEPFGFHERRLFHGLLNAALFFLFGVALEAAIPQNLPSRRKGILLLTCALGTSCLIELIQYRCAIGNVLLDVIFFRLLGAWLGWHFVRSAKARICAHCRAASINADTTKKDGLLMGKGKYLRETSLLKTIRFNLRYFGLRGLKFPVLIARSYRLKELRGHVDLCCMRFGSVRLGYSSVGIFDRRDSRGIWQVSGTIVFKGRASFGSGSKISCGPDGSMVVGDNFVNTANGSFICHDSLSIGNRCLVSWDVLVMDTDFHHIEGSAMTSPVSIGDHCRICCGARIMKGADIPDGSILAASSVVSKRLKANRPLIVEFNKVAKMGVEWHE